MNDRQLYGLKKDIREEFMSNVKKEYSQHRMSGNLARTMTRSSNYKDGTVSVFINAKEYDIWAYWYKRIIIPTGGGSYAEDNDAGSGGLKAIRNAPIQSGYRRIRASNQYGSLQLKPTYRHLNFVQRNMIKAIKDTLSANGYKKFEIKLKGR